jgi:hypothetical protein
MKILVCGSRVFNDKRKFNDVLAPYLKEYGSDLEIITGMAKGADHFAWLFAYHYDLITHKFPADWDNNGKAAGPIRNQQMIDEGRPDLVIAFPVGESRGTYDMIKRARKHNIEVIVIEPDN